MSKALLNKEELKYFLESRKKFDQVITDVLGPDIHLHEISDDEQDPRISIKQFANLAPLSKPSPHEQYQSLNHHLEKGKGKNQRFYQQSQRGRWDDESRGSKIKPDYWEKIKKFILTEDYFIRGLESISKGAIKEDILVNQFLTSVKEVIGEVRRWREGKETQEEKLADAKKKHVEDASKIYRISLQNEGLTAQNEILKEKICILSEQRKQRIDGIKSDIDLKFNSLEKELESKKQENDQLRNQLKKIEKDINQSSQLKSQSHIGLTSEFNISVEPCTHPENLKQENKLLHSEISTLNKKNKKLRKVIKIAKNLNDQFMLKIESSLKTEQNKASLKSFNDYYSALSQSKGKNDVTFKNNHFNVVRNRSMKKAILTKQNQNYQ